MKSMKKVFIGLSVVAAVGVVALCLRGAKTSEILSENVAALGSSYCAYDPGFTCDLGWDDFDDFSGDRPCLRPIRVSPPDPNGPVGAH